MIETSFKLCTVWATDCTVPFLAVGTTMMSLIARAVRGIATHEYVILRKSQLRDKSRIRRTYLQRSS